mmetsp:Transcript_4331/g.12674  ORF Transcript_4331/g.12674 Transcript_4331/m.12674 type:complete len:232 (+) Transcript_4331:4356-5051(+)
MRLRNIPFAKQWSRSPKGYFVGGTSRLPQPCGGGIRSSEITCAHQGKGQRIRGPRCYMAACRQHPRPSAHISDMPGTERGQRSGPVVPRHRRTDHLARHEVRRRGGRDRRLTVWGFDTPRAVPEESIRAPAGADSRRLPRREALHAIHGFCQRAEHHWRDPGARSGISSDQASDAQAVQGGPRQVCGSSRMKGGGSSNCCHSELKATMTAPLPGPWQAVSPMLRQVVVPVA